ncbi:NAD+ synthase [Aliarcobacter thereius]|uniref:NH(3)-dependent NAD(+) synthetase n=2 Tax=Aliarcobacter thereius TaxID=544718 RepID=A0A1C0B6S8_9BACT|nr:NAD+ synthase [Aliarcobacter thereius]OCL95959.1 NH(3)-dependent NAD(+) synthetase [Aliarcobacter thereius LMG 24486]OCL99284.1 NH(3)-dependent NAD(+) synthetase [Aliarcobacter thereius]QBF16069.1 NAD synthetase, NH3-dependent [Aliarcobacter thereius LMG 24486]TLS94591.1 NAD+ synthase [Aliarcobacter thereius]
MKEYKNIKQNLINFLQNEVKNRALNSVVVGLSGGLDSAVVAVLCKEAFDKNLTCILMPSQFSSKSSVDDSIELCEKFNINYETISIEPILSAYLNSMNNNTLRIGNFSARLRMSVLYDKSFEKNSLVVGTSNRSEILLGYSTIFGDTAYAINPIGNIYKSDLFDFARFLGVSDKILNKKPSADFYENQSDEDDLGHSYDKIDSLLKAMYDEKQSFEELIKNGFDKAFIDEISKRVEKNRFKTELAKIAKI